MRLQPKVETYCVKKVISQISSVLLMVLFATGAAAQAQPLACSPVEATANARLEEEVRRLEAQIDTNNRAADAALTQLETQLNACVAAPPARVLGTPTPPAPPAPVPIPAALVREIDVLLMQLAREFARPGR